MPWLGAREHAAGNRGDPEENRLRGSWLTKTKMARTKEEEYQDRNKRLRELGVKPVYNSLKEEKKAKKDSRDLIKKLR